MLVQILPMLFKGNGSFNPHKNTMRKLFFYSYFTDEEAKETSYINKSRKSS